MDEKDKSERIENRQAGESRNSKTDFDKEFRESFNKSLLYEKLSTTALEYIISTNPAKVVLSELDGIDEKIKQSCKERIEGQMITWLGSFEKMLSEGENLPVDLIGLASDLARKDRNRQ